MGYRGLKKFAEQEAWEFVRNKNPGFDLVTICPPMTFGPVVHTVTKEEELNEWNRRPWKIACGERPLPASGTPF